MEYDIKFIVSLTAIIISIISLLYSIWFKKEDNYSKRAYLVPGDDPGKIFFNNDRENVVLDIVNAGSNPATEITSTILFYNKEYKYLCRVDGIGSFNPIPHNDPLHIKYSFHNAEEEESFEQVEYVKLNLKYYDILLKKYFTDTFVWQTVIGKSDYGELELWECDFKAYKTIIDS